MKPGYWFILPWDPIHPGGVVNVVINLYNQIAEHGLQPSILITSWEDIKFRKEQYNGLKLCHGRLRGPLTDNIVGGMMYWLTLPAYLVRLYKDLRKDNVVCINPHYPGDSTLSFVLLRKLGGFQGRLFLSFHGTDFDDIERATGYRLAIWRFILRNVDAVLPCSNSLAIRILGKLPELEGCIHVAHNGFDQDEFDKNRDKEAKLPNELKDVEFVLNVAAFEQKKGQEVLIRAFHSLTAAYPSLKLVMIGGNAPLFDGLQQMALDLGLNEKIVFIKDLPHAKIAPYFENATLFVLPSRIEPFGIVLLEAGAFGLPVIASRVGGIPEIISSPSLGILVEPDDSSALAAAMLEVLSDPTSARTQGENLRQHVCTIFSWSNTAKTYFDLLGQPTKAGS
jgi:glycosyltransferase involved in cell wall biosynthesis